MSDLIEKLDEYFKNTPKEKIMEDWKKTEQYDKVGITVNEFLGYITSDDIIVKELEIAELTEQIRTLQNTCIELSKRAVYTEEEKQKYWEFECECGFSGLSLFVIGGGQIADTGDYGDCYCPCCGKVDD